MVTKQIQLNGKGFFFLHIICFVILSVDVFFFISWIFVFGAVARLFFTSLSCFNFNLVRILTHKLFHITFLYRCLIEFGVRTFFYIFHFESLSLFSFHLLFSFSCIDLFILELFSRFFSLLFQILFQFLSVLLFCTKDTIFFCF